MTRKVFISYSHKDESYREDLEDHLSTLRRKEVISVWHDRKILPGQEWKGEIDENLNNADLILLLISPSFLASDYCYDIEMQKAIENNKAGRCQIISIIIRPCDWPDCEFSKFQLVPKDAQPVSTWDNKDEAWLDAITKIRAHIEKFKPNIELPKNQREGDDPRISTSTTEWIQDTEITLSHRKLTKINLQDIFVIPDIELNEGESEEKIKIKTAQNILFREGYFLISGEEQQGKTSLLKHFYHQLAESENIPLYINLAEVNKSNLEENISKNLEKQYENVDLDKFLKHSKRVLLLDNLDALKLNNKYRQIFLEKINELFAAVFITCHSTFSYIHNEISALDNYEAVDLLGLGHKKREDLTRKWLSLGQEESINEKDLYAQCDEVKSRLNTIIKRNIVPPKPIYVLMLLQMFEANTQLKTELTSYGHCYQQLIYQTFGNARIRHTDFEKFLNVVSELSWWILRNEKNPNNHELNEFFDKYCKKFLPVNKDEVIDKLVNHSILQESDSKIGFKYPYIYYFFAGKKIAESYRDSQEVRKTVDTILEQIHREDFANIIIFITHHTKDSWVLSEIQKVLSQLFSEHDPATLEKQQLEFMEEFVKKIPDLVLEQREIQKERDLHNEKLDKLERDTPSKEEPESVDILAKINKTFKGMEIAGQIIRNRHASLEMAPMIDLATYGVNSGLRFLKYFIEISDAAKNEIVKLITNQLSDQPNLSDHEIRRDAETAYTHLTYGVINAVIRKIASSVGSKEANCVYEILEENNKSPATSLIRLSIDLQFKKSLDIEEVKVCAKKLQNNSVCTRILKEMIIQHIYMFPVEYQEKQKLSSLLGISVQGQRIMDQRITGKA